VRGREPGLGLGRDAGSSPTLGTELGRAGKRRPAMPTGPGERRATFLAELGLRPILALAPGTVRTERLPIPDRCCRPGSSVTAPGRRRNSASPTVPLGGTAVPTLPRAGHRRQPLANAAGRLAAGPGCLPTRWRSGGDPPADRRARAPRRAAQAPPLADGVAPPSPRAVGADREAAGNSSRRCTYPRSMLITPSRSRNSARFEGAVILHHPQRR
jgi:hypothetical protein